MFGLNQFIQGKRLFQTGILLVLLACAENVLAQDEKPKKERLSRIELKHIEAELLLDSALRRRYADLSFYYHQKYVPREVPEKKASIKFDCYLDTYYAWYSDLIQVNAYQKFPTSAPLSDQFGLNMAMASVKYEHNKVRGTFGIHYGDIAQSAWSPSNNLIQEAHFGFKLLPKVWMDAGYFRTHLGFESIQPRENLTTSVSVTTYYEPYYLNGVKLTYYPTQRINFMLGVFNGFNAYNDNNRDKTYGASCNIDFTEKWFASINTLYGNEMAYGQTPKMRLYNDLYLGYKSRQVDFVAEFNYGRQEKTRLLDSTETADMFSSTFAIKLKSKNQFWGNYYRLELFNDPNEILTGKIVNDLNEQIGLEIWGLTGGIEIKPMPNAFLRLEGRFLQGIGPRNEMFYLNRETSHNRYEIVSSLGAWF